MMTLSVDLAYRDYRDIGIVNLRQTDDHIVVEPLRLRPEAGFVGQPRTDILADFFAHVATDFSATTILIDGPQAWKSAGNGLAHSRRCERQLATPGKTGLPGTSKPNTYIGFIEFSIDLFDELEARGWRRLSADYQPHPTVSVAVESFPTSAWRSLGLKPLPAKRRAGKEAVAAKLEEICRLVPLSVDMCLTHDELQALVAGLGGLALACGKHEGYAVVGAGPVFEDGCWREGFIVNPTWPLLRTGKETVTCSS